MKMRVSTYNDMVHVEMPVKIANLMLNTEFALFRSMEQRHVLVPRITKPYFLPNEVARVVSMVDDIMRFPALRQSPQVIGSEDTPKTDTDPFSSCGRSCSGFTTPAVLTEAYSMPASTVAASGNSVSVAEFQYQYCKFHDIRIVTATRVLRVYLAFNRLTLFNKYLSRYASTDDNTDLESFSSACDVSVDVDVTVGKPWNCYYSNMQYYFQSIKTF